MADFERLFDSLKDVQQEQRKQGVVDGTNNLRKISNSLGRIATLLEKLIAPLTDPNAMLSGIYVHRSADEQVGIVKELQQEVANLNKLIIGLAENSHVEYNPRANESVSLIQIRFQRVTDEITVLSEAYIKGGHSDRENKLLELGKQFFWEAMAKIKTCYKLLEKHNKENVGKLDISVFGELIADAERVK
jgi:hypothetical protein